MLFYESHYAIWCLVWILLVCEVPSPSSIIVQIMTSYITGFSFSLCNITHKEFLNRILFQCLQIACNSKSSFLASADDDGDVKVLIVHWLGFVFLLIIAICIDWVLYTVIYLYQSLCWIYSHLVEVCFCECVLWCREGWKGSLLPVVGLELIPSLVFPCYFSFLLRKFHLIIQLIMLASLVKHMVATRDFSWATVWYKNFRLCLSPSAIFLFSIVWICRVIFLMFTYII